MCKNEQKEELDILFTKCNHEWVDTGSYQSLDADEKTYLHKVYKCSKCKAVLLKEVD